MIMAKESQTTHKRPGRSTSAHAVAVSLFIAAAMLIMVSCQRKPAMAHARFQHLPAMGWMRSQPLSFIPEYDDSAATYDIRLAVRHGNSYHYRNLALVVDIIDADSAVRREAMDVQLADEYGNWTGGGFGTLYQKVVPVVKGISHTDASRVVVWQAMAGCDTLHGVADLGVFSVPVRKN